MIYDYLEAEKNDVLDYIKENIDFSSFEDIEELEEELNEELWSEDSVTGNASGSYTFNRYLAEEHIAHNLDLLGEALEAFGCDESSIEKGAEWCDVTIRCYLLSSAISEALKEIEDDFNKAKSNALLVKAHKKRTCGPESITSSSAGRSCRRPVA